MKNQRFPEELLKSLRETLPSGSQTNIANKLSTPESPVSAREVHKVLHGKGIRYGRFDPTPIIMEAMAICKAIKASQEAVKQFAETLIDSSEKQ